MDKSLKDALTATGAFEDGDLDALDIAIEAYGPIGNWSAEQFKDALGDNVAKQIVARQTVALHKGGEVVEAGATVELPEFPPYLMREPATGRALGYDPHDPSQYWTDPVTGEMWRWDGKGRGNGYGEKSPITGERSPENRYPHGQPKRVVLVKHYAVDGVRVPDPQEAHDANASGFDWFHHGYNCWVGDGTKVYGEVTPAQRAKVIAAQARLPQANAPLVRRPPRVTAA